MLQHKSSWGSAHARRSNQQIAECAWGLAGSCRSRLYLRFKLQLKISANLKKCWWTAFLWLLPTIFWFIVVLHLPVVLSIFLVSFTFLFSYYCIDCFCLLLSFVILIFDVIVVILFCWLIVACYFQWVVVLLSSAPLFMLLLVWFLQLIDVAPISSTN